jgi:molybdopterin biosynthesis enzyme
MRSIEHLGGLFRRASKPVSAFSGPGALESFCVSAIVCFSLFLQLAHANMAQVEDTNKRIGQGKGRMNMQHAARQHDIHSQKISSRFFIY